MFRSTLASLALAFVAGFAVPAKAVPIQWTFDNVTFNDGGTVTGSFVYDYTTLAISSINVQSTTGSAFGGATYTTGINAFPGGGGVVLATDQVSPSNDLAGENLLGLILVFPVATTAGLSSLSESVCPLSGPCIQGTFTTLRTVTSGNLVGTVIPVPAALPLLVSGFAVLAAVRRRVR
jgi:hypothetical protein